MEIFNKNPNIFFVKYCFLISIPFDDNMTDINGDIFYFPFKKEEDKTKEKINIQDDNESKTMNYGKQK